MKPLKALGVGCLALSLALGALWFSCAWFVERHAERAERHLGPPLAEVDPSIIPFLTLGHRYLYDDFIYLWLIQYLIPEEGHEREPLAKLEARIHAVLAHQPRVESLYLLTCFVLALDYRLPERCEAVARVGLKAFPTSWRIPMMQAYMFAFPLERPLKAAFYYHLAASRPASPPYVGRLVQKMLAKPSWTAQDRQEVLQSILDVPNAATFKHLMDKHPSAQAR